MVCIAMFYYSTVSKMKVAVSLFNFLYTLSESIRYFTSRNRLSRFRLYLDANKA